MDHNILKPEERELVKLVNFFKKRGEVLIIENKLGDEYKQLLDTCDKLVEQLHLHAQNREAIYASREQLKGMIKDNARCPNCQGDAHLKVTGFETSPQGWKSNKYKCRKCNIMFVWNAPNNPWDMIPYVEHFVGEIEKKVSAEFTDEEARDQTLASLNQMKTNLDKLKPVIEASDNDLKAMEARDVEMTEMVKKFRKHLMIEKIKLEE